MALGDWIDGVIAPIAPGWAAQRAIDRAQFEAARTVAGSVRGYDAAKRDRANRGWTRRGGSADSENDRAREVLAWSGHELVRNNKYFAAGISQMTTMIWGDGIAVQAIHPVKRVQQRAQDQLDRFAESRVDGLGDWYAHGKIGVREMMVGGEALTLWQPDDRGPDGRVIGMEGSQLDIGKTCRLENGHRIIQGVEFDKIGNRVAYWLFDEHPSALQSMAVASKPVPAAHVDHLFERLRFGQTRGVSWAAPVATTLRDIKDLEDARLLREKIQNCLALVLHAGEQNSRSPLALGEQSAAKGDDGRKPMEESIRPGMIARMGAGESATVVNPSPALGTVEFVRQQLCAVAANLAPFHLLTGDPAGANYTTLRAVMNGAYARVTTWQQNDVIPLLVRPMAERQMRRLVLETGDRRFLDVRFGYALPVRYVVDPIKDLMGEIMEIRAGLKTISRGLAERGLNTDDHMAEIKRMNDLIDSLGLALDSDPRRLTDSGVLQAATGYLATKGGDGN